MKYNVRFHDAASLNRRANVSFEAADDTRAIQKAAQIAAEVDCLSSPGHVGRLVPSGGYVTVAEFRDVSELQR